MFDRNGMLRALLPGTGPDALSCRLLELAPLYFDIKSFSDGETKRALQRIVNKKLGKTSREEDSGPERREKKKRRKQ